MLLDDQVKLNDPGASLYIIRNLAADGWNGLLRFYEGEVWRLRGRPRRRALAGAELCRGGHLSGRPARGLAGPRLCPGQGRPARGGAGPRSPAISTLAPDAPDAAMVRHALAAIGAKSMIDGKRPGFAVARPRSARAAAPAGQAAAVRPITAWSSPSPRRSRAVRCWSARPCRWNRRRAGHDDISREENWTLNGPLLDSLTFIGGLEHGKTIVQQRRKADRKVPNFRADMSPPEIASMIESFYRIRAGSVALRHDRPQAADLPRPSRLPVRL